MGQGRFVLYGEDESSGVKWHEPTADMLAQGPDWLPYDTLRGRVEGWERRAGFDAESALISVEGTRECRGFGSALASKRRR
ncbi:hypothetical protein [Streptomyces sp. NPDC097981]|uniref:hypothetical protein n=1 Tax=Streptomyces sp. NPDC097981 TaxID=3155428 RepID=UPI0033281666